MNILYFNLHKKFQLNKDIVACIGYFDGLHLGHQKLIAETIKQAKNINVESCLISFIPDPIKIIKKMPLVNHLNSLSERIEIIKYLNIDNLIFLEFDQEMADLSVKDFSEVILKKLNLKALVVGFDFSYAKEKKGDYKNLIKDNSFEIIEIPEVKYLNNKISSSRIIHCLKNNDIESANNMLNYMYFIEGIVIVGNKKGRTIGFPTCNIQVLEETIIPSNGIYVGYVLFKNRYYKAMINIGHNPTFNFVNNISIEVHILDFNQNMYSEKLRVYFNKFIKEEVKYTDLNNLILALNEYKKIAANQSEYITKGFLCL